MGCCGCDNKASAITAGIFGLIQSSVGLILNAYFITLYSSYSYPYYEDILDNRIFLLYATYSAHTCIFGLLVVATILHGSWLLSSIILLIGNARTFVEVFASMSGQTSDPGRNNDLLLDRFIKWASTTVTIDFMKYYIILLGSFIKFGPITFIANVCLNVFTDRRASDICRRHDQAVGSTVTVIQGYPVFPGMMNVMGSEMVLTHPAFVNNGGIPRSGATNSSYSQNMPVQSSVNSSSLQAASDNRPTSNGSHTIRNVLTETLNTPKLNNESPRGELSSVTRDN